MPKLLLLEEYHIAVQVPAKMPDDECRAIRRLLNSRAIRKQLRNALEDLLARHPVLAQIRLAITR